MFGRRNTDLRALADWVMVAAPVLAPQVSRFGDRDALVLTIDPSQWQTVYPQRGQWFIEAVVLDDDGTPSRFQVPADPLMLATTTSTEQLGVEILNWVASSLRNTLNSDWSEGEKAAARRLLPHLKSFGIR